MNLTKIKINNFSKDLSIFKIIDIFRRGFSIIEIIIYLAIFTIMSIVVINSFMVIISSFSSVRMNHDLSDGGSVSMEKISREIRQAKNVDMINSSNSLLQLNSTDSSGNNMIIKIVKEGNLLNFYRNGNLIGNLLDNNTILNLISFDYITTVNSTGVKIKMTLQENHNQNVKIENFYDAVILRGGY